MEFQASLFTTKVKVKSCFFILYLCCQQYFLKTNASVKKSDVAKYLIERKYIDKGNKLSVLFKQGCHENRCNPTCADPSAEDPAVSRENFTHSCSCKFNVHLERFSQKKENALQRIKLLII